MIVASPLRFALVACVLGAALGCGGSGGDGSSLASNGGHGNPSKDASVTEGGLLDGPIGGFDATLDSASQGFQIVPDTLQTITVPAGQTSPTVTYTATLDGHAATPAWAVDKGAVGAVAQGSGGAATFTPTGAAGGLVTLQASLNGQTLTRQVMVQLTGSQNGANAGSPAEQAQIPAGVSDLSAGGGVGGVGGEGLGVAVSDTATQTALGSPSSSGAAQSLSFLYPYDGTVWPRGLAAPLLMWSWTTGDADAIRIDLATQSASFSWSGTFGKPAILSQTGGAFVRHPIPQDVWDMATESADGKSDPLTVKLTVAKGGVAYGPIAMTWIVAPARLTGTVYYNSYGTQLVKNWVAADGAGHAVGAAILGIRSGASAPSLVVGQDSPLDGSGHPTDDTGCRVCHVVSSRGRWLLTQSEQGSPGDGRSFLYDLTAANVQASAATLPQEGVFGWAGLVSDGSYALTNAIDPSSTNPAISGSRGGGATSSFWQFGATPQADTLSGLPSPVAAGYPSFAPDDRFAAYVDVTGKTNDATGPIVVAAYDATTRAFSGVASPVSPKSGQRVGYPVFLPDDSGLVFETEIRSSQSDSVMVTRNGARSELWWTNVGASPQPVALAALNGKTPSGTSYLPALPGNHGVAGAHDPRSTYDESAYDDTTLDYEPTVLPLVAGGYAWVVFTSRRAYGNELTSVPWQSWPPDYDTTSRAQATVKKLWVAAIDLGAPAGSDPSHPAFYLPAQELLAGNSRGFWVLDPCHPDGQACSTGDQCCGGYCEPSDDGGPLACSSTPPSSHCSAPQEKCQSTTDCCDPTNTCVNGFCGTSVH